MMDDERLDRLADLFRVLADPTRLRILGAIAERPLTGKDLSERLRLTPPTISHHMARLVSAGLVRVTRDAQRRAYSLDQAALSDLSRTASSAAESAAGSPTAETDDGSAEERERAKVLRDFFVDGRLKQIPAQRKKRVFVLQHLLSRFTPGREYSEREVNDLLRTAHEDVATLRRELVDYGFMTREKGIYRVATALPDRGATVAQEISGDEHAWLRALVESATTRALGTESPTGNAIS